MTSPEPQPGVQEALETLLSKARELERSGDLPGARGLLQQAPAALQAFGSWHYAAGALAARAKDPTAALAAFEEAVRREPEVPEFKANLGAALLERAKGGDRQALARATLVLEECCAAGPRLAHAFTNLGMARLLAGDAQGALSSFEQALRREPRDVTALYDRAAALHQLGRLEECLKALEATLAVEPSFEPALASRRNTLAKLGR